MEAEVGVCSGDVCPDGEDDFNHVRDLYGLALTLLPSALVRALEEPLLLHVGPMRPTLSLLLPERIPSWWLQRSLRTSPARVPAK